MRNSRLLCRPPAGTPSFDSGARTFVSKLGIYWIVAGPLGWSTLGQSIVSMLAEWTIRTRILLKKLDRLRFALSASTGHLDVIGSGDRVPVEQQRSNILSTPGCQKASWGEPPIEEIIVVLKSANENREARPTTGAAEPWSMRSLRWERQDRARRKACVS
jgi:hypothetical protein